MCGGGEYSDPAVQETWRLGWGGRIQQSGKEEGRADNERKESASKNDLKQGDYSSTLLGREGMTPHNPDSAALGLVVDLST